MSASTSMHISRRAVLQGTGALIVSFAIPWTDALQAAQTAGLPGNLDEEPFLDAWIRVSSNGSVAVFTGKVEFGQGIKTALLQVVAEELEVPLTQLQLVTADTARTPNEGYTSGSVSLEDSGTALRHAAAQVREILIAEAARRLGESANRLRAENAAIAALDGRRMNYGELVGDELLHVRAQPTSKLKDPARFEVMNRAVPRIDIPAKVSGGEAYVQDLKLPGMLHARVVRPPSYGARLLSVDLARVEKLPGVVKVVRDGSFLAVVAERERQAVRAMQALTDAARWEERASLPKQGQLHRKLLDLPAEETTILDRHAVIEDARQQAEAGKPASTPDRQSTVEAHTKLEASYTRGYLAHGSIGPSCAVAQLQDDFLTVWTHSQGVYPLRGAIAQMLGIPAEKVRCVHREGSGCYGHNGADDAAGDAALLASALPGRPIRVQWMRQQEHAWEPYGAAMIARARAALDATGRIVDWEYHVWSNTHSMRPGPAGALLAAQHSSRAFAPPPPRAIPQPAGGGDRNAIAPYTLPKARVVHHFIPAMPVRVSALRALGAHMNVFSIESFMEELALAARVDPVEFRLRHLDDARARDVVATAAEKFGWAPRSRTAGRGHGFGFARYKNLAAYCAVAMEVAIGPDGTEPRVVRAVAAVDTGQVVNPDGVRNQIEGAILQSLSWTLYEQVSFDDTRITSIDWATYPILRFSAVPTSIEVHIIDRPGSAFLGCGEAAQGPAAAALSNAIANATGKRLRDLPFTANRAR